MDPTKNPDAKEDFQSMIGGMDTMQQPPEE
jgi:hypothetical protein